MKLFKDRSFDKEALITFFAEIVDFILAVLLVLGPTIGFCLLLIYYPAHVCIVLFALFPIYWCFCVLIRFWKWLRLEFNAIFPLKEDKGQ